MTLACLDSPHACRGLPRFVLVCETVRTCPTHFSVCGVPRKSLRSGSTAASGSRSRGWSSSPRRPSGPRTRYLRRSSRFRTRSLVAGSNSLRTPHAAYGDLSSNRRSFRGLLGDARAHCAAHRTARSLNAKNLHKWRTGAITVARSQISRRAPRGSLPSRNQAVTIRLSRQVEPKRRPEAETEKRHPGLAGPQFSSGRMPERQGRRADEQ
jgi:hypothetical protein